MVMVTCEKVMVSDRNRLIEYTLCKKKKNNNNNNTNLKYCVPIIIQHIILLFFSPKFPASQFLQVLQFYPTMNYSTLYVFYLNPCIVLCCGTI